MIVDNLLEAPGLVVQLADDQCGSRLIQSIFDQGTVTMKRALLVMLEEELLNLSNAEHGCRVVQKAVATVPRESQQLIAEALKSDVIRCAKNIHGNYVIQKCIEQ